MKKYKIALIALIAGFLIAGLFLILRSLDIAVLDPKGLIAEKQRGLMVLTTLLMLIVVIPVFALTIFIAWRYREGNTRARYSPDWDHSRTIEITWWVFPSVIILLLAVVTWRSTHELDPFKEIPSSNKAVTVQAVALQWKWLFIYPEQKVASVNYLQIPRDTPVIFEVTADAPMNSFWIPSLGGQIYAMPAMKTKLSLLAHEHGEYEGVSANISGEGFSGMNFSVKVSNSEDFEQWISQAKKSPSGLSSDAYEMLAMPSKDNEVAFYGIVEDDLFNRIIGSYLAPAPQLSGVSTGHRHDGTEEIN